MDKKIKLLFKYREIPFLLKHLEKNERKYLDVQLVKIQKAIYKLDQYLENNWELNEARLKKFWKSIDKSIYKLGFEMDEVNVLTSHIKKYQLHESQLRSGKLPTRLSLEYYYYYKSCDVRLIREIIYAFHDNLDSELPIHNWRYYDLVTEINDDIEDVFEDQDTINGNCFLISIVEEGKAQAKLKYSVFLEELRSKSIKKLANSTDSRKIRIHYFTLKRIEETLMLLDLNLKKIKFKTLKEKIVLFNHLEKKVNLSLN